MEHGHSSKIVFDSEFASGIIPGNRLGGPVEGILIMIFSLMANKGKNDFKGPAGVCQFLQNP